MGNNVLAVEDDVLTVEEIASILHIKPNTIHNKKWQKRSGCPLIKPGKRLYAIAVDFWKWFRSCRIL